MNMRATIRKKSNAFSRKTLLVAGVLVVGMSIIAQVTPSEALAAQPKTLALNTAISHAFENSLTMKTAELDLADAKLSYDQAKANNLARASVLSMLQAELNWAVAQQNHSKSKASLIASVQQTYYNVLKAQISRDISQKAYQQAVDQLKVAQQKFKLGMVAQVDVLNAESQLASAEANLAQGEANLVVAKMRFNSTVGLDLDEPVELKDEFTSEPVKIELDKALQEALSNRIELVKAEETVAIRQKEVDVNDNEYTPPLTLQQSKNNLARAQYDLERQKANIIVEVRQNYEATKEAAKRIEIQKKSQVASKENYRIAQLQYDAGIITGAELFNAQKSAFQAETQVLQAVFDYNVALATFYQSIGRNWQPEQPAGTTSSAAGK